MCMEIKRKLDRINELRERTERAKAKKLQEIEDIARQVSEAYKKVEKMEEVSQVIIEFDKMQEDPDTLQMFMFGIFWVKVSNLTSKEA